MKLSGNTTGMENFTVTVAATTIYLTPNSTSHTSYIPTSSTAPAILTASPSTAGAAPTAVANPMLQIEQLLSPAPQCIQPAAIGLAALTGCGVDSQCICSDKTFMASLMGAMELKCIPTEWHETQSWVTQLCPNLKENRKGDVIGVVTVMQLLATMSVILRVVSKRIGHVKFWWDDYLIFAAFFVTIGEAINYYVSTRFGFGKHFILLSALEITAYLKTFWVSQCLFAFSITFIKLSILLFYRRIFASRPITIILIFTGLFQFAWFLAQLISVLLSCRPLAYFWDKAIPHGHCIDENVAGYAITASSLLIDLIIFVIPIPPLMKLQKSLSQRLSLIALFLVGAFVCIAGIIRIPLLVQLDTRDLTYTIVPAGIWINLETHLGIVCACLPTFKPLFRAVSAAMRSRFSRLTSNGSSGQGASTDQEDNGAAVVVPNGDEKAGKKGDGWASAVLKEWPEDEENEKEREKEREREREKV